MRFTKLVIENFSSYYGKHTIEFNTSLEKPVTIIVGGGGKGKTSIFDAINWALYGQQYEPDIKQELQKEITDYVNETALKESYESNSVVEMACTLYFEHEEKKYRIQQAICAKPVKNRVEITDRTSTLYEIGPTGNNREINYIESFLNEILPSNVRDYFLFNGDRINRLALPGSSEEIKDGIYRVVDLELLQKGAEHLNDVAKKFRKQAKDSSVGEMADIETAYTDAHNARDRFRNELNNFTQERISLSDTIEIIESKLKQVDGIRELQKNREILKERLKFFQDKHRQILANLRSCASTAILCFSIQDIDTLSKELDAKRTRGEIPSAISEGLLMDILDMKKCICGSEFDHGDALHQELTRRLHYERTKGKEGHNLLELFYDLKESKTEILRDKEKIPNLEKERIEIENSINNWQKEMDEIITKLQGAPLEDIQQLAKNLHDSIEEEKNIEINIITLQRKIEEKDQLIKQLYLKRDELGKKQLKVKKFQLRDNLAQNAANELQRIFEKFAEDSRHEIEVLTKEEFQKFIPSAQSLSVSINNEFHYDIRDQNGNPALQQLSMGQKQSLSLAYITSISRVSEKNPPLVIDMPFGRLDNDVQENIASRLPDLSSQVILLVLPGTEWNEKTEAILRNKTSDQYYLDFNEELRQTIIKKG